MYKLITCVFALFILSFAVSSANMLELVKVETPVKGDKIESEIKSHFDFLNNSDQELTLKISIIIEQLVPGHAAAYCSDVCYMPVTENWDGASSFTVPAHSKYTDVNPTGVSTYLYPNGIEGESTIHFVVYDVNDSNNELNISTTFKAENGSSVESENGLISAFPNPAKDKISLNFSENAQELLIFNSMGSQLASFDVKNSKGNLSLDLTNYAQGAYFYSVRTQSGVSQVKSFAIAR